MLQVCLILMFSNIFALCKCGPGFVDIDRSKYEQGKSHFEMMDSHSRIPKYGQCWRGAITVIEKGCKQLTHVVQSRLALSYLNCFLADQDRPIYPCDLDQSVASCTKYMSDVDRGSFTTFFTYTQNICYFLESQVWHQETEQTITRLAHSSEDVADRLEESSKMQESMINQQNLTIQNQEIILEKAVNLSDIISTSSESMQTLYMEFKKSTIEQKLLINDMFDKVTKLQTMVLGEFSGFYSMIYYTVSVIISYLLTSTQRTSSARFWLFGILTIGIIAERALISISNRALSHYFDMSSIDLEEFVYSNQWLCRKVCGSFAVVVLMIFAYRYRDLDAANNELLMDIKRQNSELRQYLLNTTLSGNFGLKNQEQLPGEQNDMFTVSTSLAVAADSTRCESDSALSDCSTDTSSMETDHTFQPALSDLDELESRNSSSVLSSDLSRLSEQENDVIKPTSDPSLNIETWAKTGFYKHPTPKKDDSDRDSSIAESTRRIRGKSRTPQQSTSNTIHRYPLRPRTRRQHDNPITRTESPRSFTHVVKQLERVALKNSMLASRYTISRKSYISGASDSE